MKHAKWIKPQIINPHAYQTYTDSHTQPTKRSHPLKDPQYTIYMIKQ